MLRFGFREIAIIHLALIEGHVHQRGLREARPGHAAMQEGHPLKRGLLEIHAA